MTTLTATSQVATTAAILAYLMWRTVGWRDGAQSRRRVQVSVAFVIFVGFNALIQDGNTRTLLLLFVCAPTASAVTYSRIKQRSRRLTTSRSLRRP